MSLTIEFFSAEPQELVTLFTELAVASDDASFYSLSKALQHFPIAEFPGHLLIPDDLDNFCHILELYRPQIPSKFADICAEEIWADGFNTESLLLMMAQFTEELACINEKEIQSIALDWFSMFNLPSPPSQSPAYQAVLRLKEVAYDAFSHKRALIFHIAGVPGFFSYLRDL